MGFDFVAPATADGGEIMRDYGRQRREWLASKAGFETVIDGDGIAQVIERPAPEKGRTITRIAERRQIEPGDLGTAPRRVYAAAVAFGLEARAWLVVNDVSPVLYVADGEDYSAGDVRFEGYVARQYTVEARHPQHRMGFQAHYLGKGPDGSTASFESARVADPLGILVENWVDYTLNPVPGEKPAEKERRIQEGMAMNRRINDGSDRTEHVRYFTAGGDFTRWFDEWLGQKGIKPLTPQRKPKETPEDRESALLNGGEWNG
jgi:hypothetical protein